MTDFAAALRRGLQTARSAASLASVVACGIGIVAAASVFGTSGRVPAASATGIARHAAVTPPQRGSTRGRLARGQLLVASPRLVDPNFGRTVVLLLECDESGALGLVLNRQTEMDLARLLPQIEELRGTTHPVYVGGPVARDGVLLLSRGASPPAGARAVLPDVHASGSLQALRASIAEGTEFRAFLGHAGWGPKQLDAEVGRGDWLIAPATAADVFAPEPDVLWSALMRRLAGEWTRKKPPPFPTAALAFLDLPGG